MDARTFVISDGLGHPPSRLRTAAVLALLATLWITTRHYLGVVHDARLYTAQALETLNPGRFADDLFFRYGSQDSFTIYSRLYGPLVGALGVSDAHRLAAALGQGLWLAALGWLVSSLFEDGKCRLTALALPLTTSRPRRCELLADARIGVELNVLVMKN